MVGSSVFFLLCPPQAYHLVSPNESKGMSDYIPSSSAAFAAGAIVLHQACVPFSLKDIFGDGDNAPADVSNVKLDARSHTIRVSKDPIGGYRRIVISDVLRVLHRSSAHAATQYVSALKKNSEIWEELRPHLLYVQFSGQGVKAVPTLTLEGTYILMLKLPGEVGMGLRRNAADAMMRIAAGDPRLAETLRANARFHDLFTEVAREGVAAADAAADGGGAPAEAQPPAPADNNIVEDFGRKQRELKLRRETVSVSKQEAALRAKEAALRVKEAAAEAEALKIAADGKTAALKIEADGKTAALKIEVDGKKLIANEEIAILRRKDDAEHRSRKRRHEDDALQNLLDLPRAVAELRVVMCISNTPEGQKQVNDVIAMWRQIAAVHLNAPPPLPPQPQQPEEEYEEAEAEPAPPAPAGPCNDMPGAFTLRTYIEKHKSLARVPAGKDVRLLMQEAGKRLTQACRQHGIALPAKTDEGGQDVRMYPPTAEKHAHAILAQLVRDHQKQPNIGSFFQSMPSAAASAEADA